MFKVAFEAFLTLNVDPVFLFPQMLPDQLIVASFFGFYPKEMSSSNNEDLGSQSCSKEYLCLREAECANSSQTAPDDGIEPGLLEL